MEKRMTAGSSGTTRKVPPSFVVKRHVALLVWVGITWKEGSFCVGLGFRKSGVEAGQVHSSCGLEVWQPTRRQEMRLGHVTLKEEHRGHESLNKQRESAAAQGGVEPCSS